MSVSQPVRTVLRSSFVLVKGLCDTAEKLELS